MQQQSQGCSANGCSQQRFDQKIPCTKSQCSKLPCYFCGRVLTGGRERTMAYTAAGEREAPGADNVYGTIP